MGYINRHLKYANSYLSNRRVISISKPNTNIKIKLSTYFIIKDILEIINNNIFLLLSILWCTIIFLYSNQPASISANTSASVGNTLNQIVLFRLIFRIIPIRKCAHMFLYFVLSILLFMNFIDKNKYPRILTLLLAYTYASIDEIHQLFVVGRSGELRDTFIDLCGAIIGVVLISFIYFIINKYKDKTYNIY